MRFYVISDDAGYVVATFDATLKHGVGFNFMREAMRILTSTGKDYTMHQFATQIAPVVGATVSELISGPTGGTLRTIPYPV